MELVHAVHEGGDSEMLKACLVGAAVTLLMVAIPVVHFVTAIPSAFIGGYMAGARAEAQGGQALEVGALMAAILVLPVGGVFFLTSLIEFHMGISVIAILSVAFAVWIFLLGTLGAAIGGNSAHKAADS